MFATTSLGNGGNFLPSEQGGTMQLLATSPAIIDGDTDTPQLERLADDLSRIARSITALTTRQPDSLAAKSLQPVDRTQWIGFEGAIQPVARTPAAAEVRQVLRKRRLRSKFFRSDLFADPAWDMLLDLFATHLERDKISVTSLCIAAAVPATTALRWIKTMSDDGLIERRADPHDRRRIYVALTAEGFYQMCRYFDAVGK